VHPSRLLRKGIENARTTTEPHANFLSPTEAPIASPLGLACVGQAVAMAACEQVACRIENCDASAAKPPLRVNRADKPWAVPAEGAARPCYWHALPDVPPFRFTTAPGAIQEQNGVVSGLDSNFAGRLAISRP
jgi:hypothetical protein